MQRIIAIVLATWIVAGCASTTQPSPSPAPSRSHETSTSTPATASPAATPLATAALSRDDRWREGLAAIVPGLERLHPDPFHSTPKAEIQQAVDELSAAIPTLDDDHALAGLLRIVALVSADGRDAHTGVYPWGEGTYPVTSLPLRLWIFPDGVHVVDALPPYEDLVGARVTAVGDRPIGDAIDALDPLIPRDNDTTVKLLLPRFLLIPEILRGAGVIDDTSSVTVSVADADGAKRDVAIDPVTIADYNAWAGPYGLHLPDDPGVRYLARATEPLWFEDAAPGMVYVGYNRVDGVRQADLDALTARLAEPGITDVIVDIRHNYGGQVSALQPVLDTLETAPGGAHRWLLTGRNTFSGGSMFAARYAAGGGVTVVGEPTGGAPNMWANPRPVELGETGLVLDVSTLWEVAADPDDQRLTIEPDIPIALTAADWAAGRDPVLQTVIAADR